LGLGTITPGGGFRENRIKSYGGDSPESLLVFPGELYASLKGATKDGDMVGSVACLPDAVRVGRLTQDNVRLYFRPESDFLAFRRLLYWVLRSPQCRAYCAGRATGSAQVGLSREDFLAYSVPPLSTERRALTTLFDVLDDKIELNRKMNKTLEEMAQALFKSWFIDFDGHDDLVESQIGLVPRGWEVIPLSRAGAWMSGGTPSKKDPAYWDGGIPWFSAKSLGPLWLSDSERRVTEIGAESGTRRVPRRTVLFVVRGMSLANEWRIGLTTREATLNQDLKAIVDDGTVLPELVFLWLLENRELIRAKADEAGHGTKRLPTEVLHSHAMAMPSRVVQERMAAPLLELLARIEVNLAECSTLARLVDGLLPKLVGGDIRVPDPVPSIEQ
jgi:type I restriction enzyme S subunit